ncbi:MAG: NAD(P)-dependent oxidoreductase [Candidatus Bathyarchaeota archaeon]|nr:NAD(P)-dependent oxidoreductase [Candidatus Bathyarchaeota archaeon]
MKGAEAVVHLAADARVSASWNSVLKRNIIGTYNVFEAARRSGVRKVVFASSNHACGFSVKESDLVGPDAPVRPDSLYGVSKVFGEALGRYYSDRFGLSVICLRIGFVRSRELGTFFREILSGERTDTVCPGEKLAAMWISGRDVAQLIHRSLETDLKFGIFYGTSDNTPAVLDISDAKQELGYEPQDRLEDHLP